MKHNDSQSLKAALSALADNERGDNEGMTDAELIGLACKDKEAMLSWQCAHLTRDVLQADYTAALQPGFAARVSAQIAAEAPLQIDTDYQMKSERVVSLSDARQRAAQGKRARQPASRSAVPNQNEPFKLWKPVAGLGLAASLAGATLLFSQIWQTEKLDGPQVAESSGDAVTQPVVIAETDTVIESNDVETLQASVHVSVPMENRGTRWRMDSDLPRNEQIEQRLNTLLTNHLEDASMGRDTGMMSHSRVVGYDSVQGDQ